MRYHSDPKQYYKVEYFQAQDVALNFVKKRFDQPGYVIYSSLESLLLKAAKKEEFLTELDTVTQFYGEDFKPSLLKLHLEMLGTSFLDSPSELLTFPDFKEHMKSLSPGMQSSMSEAYTLLSYASDKCCFGKKCFGSEKGKGLFTLNNEPNTIEQSDGSSCT